MLSSLKSKLIKELTLTEERKSSTIYSLNSNYISFNRPVFHCATRRINVRTDDHPSNKSNTVEISMVVSRIFRKGFKTRNDFYLLCDFASQDMLDLELVAKAIAVYK
ncbi:MAG: hypothetical protein PHN58_05825, partial [Candidatus Cloacimonetes bacterium]|nr:hypothetical protein [Candidatus Cloacimonadota bacterium]